MSKLEERLKSLREESKYSQREVAEKLGISTSAYGYYEHGKTTPDTEMLLKLANLFQVTTDYLLGRSDEKYSLTSLTDKQKEAFWLANDLTDTEFRNIMTLVYDFKKRT